MTRQTIRLFPLALLTLAFGMAHAQAKPNFTGTWKVNVAKSDFGAMPAPDSRTDKITHEDTDLKVHVAQRLGVRNEAPRERFESSIPNR